MFERHNYILICFTTVALMLPGLAFSSSEKLFDLKIQESNFSTQDASLLNSIKTAWVNKCGSKDLSSNCMLRERDVFASSTNPDFVLLFRGELQIRPAGLSALGAFAAKYPSFCGVPCSEKSLIQNLQRVLKKMPSEAPGAFCNEHINQFIFNVDVDRWFETKHKDSCSGEPIVLLGTQHILGVNDIKIQKDNDSFPLDPFISLSQDPNIAFKFAKFHEDASGRLLIISVHQNRVPNVPTPLSQADYENENRFDIGNYFRFSETLNFAIEREVSAFIEIPKQDIKLTVTPLSAYTAKKFGL